MITVEQIKAARGLLEWTQDDLADHAIVSRPAVNNLERRITRPHSGTLEKIQKAFEKHGVEFIDGGVRLKQHVLNVQVFEGDTAYFKLCDDVFETLRQTGGELLIAGVRERVFFKQAGKRLIDILKKYEEHDIKEKILIAEGDTDLLQPPEYYRWVSSDIFAQVPYFVYADKYALLLWEPVQRVVLIENSPIAESYRKQFYAHWKKGSVPQVNKSPKN